jgi:hypothetical protein
VNKAEREYQNRVRDAGCLVCVKLGTPGTLASIHHVRKFGGLRSLRERDVIAMCPHHHTELHANRRNYGDLYGFTEVELMEQTFNQHAAAYGLAKEIA